VPTRKEITERREVRILMIRFKSTGRQSARLRLDAVNRWRVLQLGGLALFLAGCSLKSGPKNSQNTFRPKGEAAQKIDNLMQPVFWIAIIIATAVLVATVFIAIRFRQRKGSDSRPKQIHGSTPFEISWTILPAVILAVVAIPTVSLIFDLDAKPKDPLNVTVVGKQWWWQFDYPQQAGIDKKIVTANELHIPTGRNVALDLTACDKSLGTVDENAACSVIHSFWVPELSGKRDVVPGHRNTLTLYTDKPGTYLGQCAEYCGLSHANMRFRVIAQSPEDFEAWTANQLDGPAVALSDSGGAENLFVKIYGCTGCHTTADSSLSVYGPNLTHLASRTTFASGSYPLNRANLIDWIYDSPSLVPMESKSCRLPPPATCVGMPSFSKNTPPGMPSMTRAEAAELADYLLQLK